VISTLLALSLAAAPLPPPLSPSLPRSGGDGRGEGALTLAQEEWNPPPEYGEEEHRPHLFLSGWGGTALSGGGSGRSSTLYGGEIAWAFESLDLGVSGWQYKNLPDASRTWTPVALLRLTERFKTRAGVEATFGFGLGAGRRTGWSAWYQLALGMRLPLGPMFLGGELAFEQNDILRLAAGVGVAF
jgi:hypothetical protein